MSILHKSIGVGNCETSELIRALSADIVGNAYSYSMSEKLRKVIELRNVIDTKHSQKQMDVTFKLSKIKEQLAILQDDYNYESVIKQRDSHIPVELFEGNVNELSTEDNIQMYENLRINSLKTTSDENQIETNFEDDAQIEAKSCDDVFSDECTKESSRRCFSEYSVHSSIEETGKVAASSESLNDLSKDQIKPINTTINASLEKLLSTSNEMGGAKSKIQKLNKIITTDKPQQCIVTESAPYHNIMSSVHSNILDSPVLKSLHSKSMALNKDYNNDILCSDNLPIQSDDEK